MTKIEISGFGRSVTVEADDTLDALKEVALDIFDKTKDPQLVKGFGVNAVFNERADGGPTYYQPSDGAL